MTMVMILTTQMMTMMVAMMMLIGVVRYRIRGGCVLQKCDKE